MSKRWLLLAAVLFFLASGWFAIQNKREAQRQVAAILAADAAGTDVTAAVNTSVQPPILTLKQFVATHVNASVSFQLTAAYSRAETAARAAASTTTSNSQLYAQAQQACGGRTDSITQAKCVQDYVSKRLIAAPSPSPVAPPDPKAFRYAYNSPLWTPDLAGALALGGLLALIGLVFQNLSSRRNRYAR